MKFVKKFIRKLSVFDLGLIAVILVFGSSFYLFFYRKPVYVNIRVKVTDQDVLYQQIEPKNWYANRFKIGDSELDSLGRKISEIVGVESFNVSAERKAVYLDLKVRSTYDTRTKLYYARGKPLIFGSPVRFNLSNVTFDGIVTEFPRSTYQKELKVGTAQVTALARELEPAVAYYLKKDDEIHDSNGVLLAKIDSIEVKPAEQVTQTDAGDLLLRLNPLYKDILMTVSVRTKSVHQEMYVFDNVSLKVGEKLPLNFEKASIFPIITGFTTKH